MAQELTGKQARAVILVADDELSDEEIAGQLGIGRRTLTRWKQDPAFGTAVREHIGQLAADLSRFAIARKDKRLAAYQDRWEKLHRLIEARGEALADEVAGGETGLVSKEIEIAKDGTVIENYKTDGGLLGAMLQLEKQAAVEAGQWAEKHEHAGEILIRRYIGVDLDQL